jgi:hypothetical protein
MSLQGGGLREHGFSDVELGRKAGGSLGPVAEPVMETATVPVAKVHFGEGVGEAAGILKLGDYVEIGQAVLEHEVDLVADGLREAGDFAVAWMAVPAKGGVDRFPEMEQAGGRDGVMEWWSHGVVDG